MYYSFVSTSAAAFEVSLYLLVHYLTFMIIILQCVILHVTICSSACALL